MSFKTRNIKTYDLCICKRILFNFKLTAEVWAYQHHSLVSTVYVNSIQ